MSRELVTLTAGRLELQISPSIGGAIAGFRYMAANSVPILREAAAPLRTVLDAASFPLVPFVNRVRGGAFDVRGRMVRLAPNMAGDPSPLHGQGWLGAWTVESAAADSATLTFEHAAGEWPWAYVARQEFVLDEGGLGIGLTCRNLADEPMPCGLGQHPYFPCGPATRLDSRAEHVWTIDEHVLPVERIPATGRFDLRERQACGQDLDHGFGGWSGRARLSDPDWPFDVTISSATARFFQIYSPKAGGVVVAEPVTHANAAMNAPENEWPELGLAILGPGEAMRLDMRIDVTAKGSSTPSG